MRAGKCGFCYKFAFMKSKYQYDIIFKLRRIRQSKGYSQAKVADILGISKVQVGNIETYSRPHKYTLSQIEVLCQLFDLPMESLFFQEGTDMSKVSISEILHQIILYEG